MSFSRLSEALCRDGFYHPQTGSLRICFCDSMTLLSESLAMNTHPALICAFTLIPVAVIGCLIFVLIKGFNLQRTTKEAQGSCLPFFKPSSASQDEKSPVRAGAALQDLPSFSTQESLFIGQGRENTTAPTTVPIPEPCQRRSSRLTWNLTPSRVAPRARSPSRLTSSNEDAA